jgi:hypothetical protein
MSDQAHTPTCIHCRSSAATDVEYWMRQIDLGGHGSRDVPVVSFRCGSCGKRNQYDVPQV